MFTLKTRVAGVRFRNKDKTSRQDKLGIIYDDYWREDGEDEIRLALQRDEKNKHDRYAVAVVVTSPKKARGRVGYVPQDNSEFVSQALEEGRVARVDLIDMGSAGRKAEIWAKIAIRIRDQERPGSDECLVEDAQGRVYELE